MNYKERRDIILKLLDNKDSISFNELEMNLLVSPATIRRDLKKMQENQLIDRYHGGIKQHEYMTQEVPITEKQNIDLESKKRIGAYAASLIQPHELIFIDSGSSTLAMTEYINDESITVVTNGILHIQQLKEKGINCFLLCGFLKYRSNALLGSETTHLMKSFRFDRAFLGANAVDLQDGMSTPDELEKNLKEIGIQQSKESFVLVDHSKFGKKSFYTMDQVNYDKVTFITDQKNTENTKFRFIFV